MTRERRSGLTVGRAVSLRHATGPIPLVRCTPLVSYVNVLAVRFGFRLIHRLDEVSSVIGVHVTGLYARDVSRITMSSR